MVTGTETWLPEQWTLAATAERAGDEVTVHLREVRTTVRDLEIPLEMLQDLAGATLASVGPERLLDLADRNGVVSNTIEAVDIGTDVRQTVVTKWVSQW